MSTTKDKFYKTWAGWRKAVFAEARKRKIVIVIDGDKDIAEAIRHEDGRVISIGAWDGKAGYAVNRIE